MRTANHTAQPEAAAPASFSWSGALRARHIAMPAEHGAWIFLFTPLAIGLAAGGVRLASFFLVTGVLAAFLVRQPVAIGVKAFSGRRPKSELPTARFWLAVYGLAGAAAAAALLAFGYGFILVLAVPALPVFAWHLWLVSRRAERRQALMEITASGVLALAAPAAFWVGRGQYDPAGWSLWFLSWLQVAGTILYAYLRLEQRQLKQAPGRAQSLQMAWPALVYNLAALAAAVGFSTSGLAPAWVFLAYLIQPAETLWGMLHAAVGVKPKVIGFRQLAVSLLFTLVFILTWVMPPSGLF